MYNCNFIIVCPPFTWNGDSKEEWYLGVCERDREDSCHLEVSEVIRFNKYTVTNVVIQYGKDSQHNLVHGRETQKANSLKIKSLKCFEVLHRETFIIPSNASPMAKVTEVSNRLWPELVCQVECGMAQRNSRNDLRLKSS